MCELVKTLEEELKFLITSLEQVTRMSAYELPCCVSNECSTHGGDWRSFTSRGTPAGNPTSYNQN
jgi:hypothetical protein